MGSALAGTEPQHSDNRALRLAMQRGASLIYFVGVDRSVYVPRYPVWLLGEVPQRREFTVAIDEGQRLVDWEALTAPQREYVRRLTNLRLHQPVFRARVLRAYGESCAMCRLRHADLLDAAHILPDTHPRGEPVVPNGLALCKIHHAAYDRNILGVRPDLEVEVQPRVLAEIDGRCSGTDCRRWPAYGSSCRDALTPSLTATGSASATSSSAPSGRR